MRSCMIYFSLSWQACRENLSQNSELTVRVAKYVKALQSAISLMFLLVRDRLCLSSSSLSVVIIFCFLPTSSKPRK